jgi:hypothetical protein
LWGYDNDVYKVKTCMEFYEKLGGKSATIAFIIGDSTGKMAQDIYNEKALADFAAFQKVGG